MKVKDIMTTAPRTCSCNTNLAAASALRTLLAAHRDASDLISVGAYVSGANAKVDTAVRLMPAIERFLRQRPEEPAPFAATVEALTDLIEQWEVTS